MDFMGGQSWRLDTGDAVERLRALPAGAFHCCVTSPPYFALRDYGVAGQIGLEKSPYCWGWTTGNPCGSCYCCRMVAVFAEVRRVLRDDGVCWLNVGDSYASNWPCNRRNVIGTGSMPNGKREARPPRMAQDTKDKDLLGIPWALAFALRAAGWYLRSECLWTKVSPMPESVRDRPTRAHEQVFLLTKSARYFYDQEAERVPHSEASESRAQYGGRVHPRGWHTDAVPISGGENDLEGLNPAGRNLWTYWLDISPEPYAEAHFATFPPDLPERCIKLGTSEKGCCPACGAPWRRVVERQRKATRPGLDSKIQSVKNSFRPPAGMNSDKSTLSSFVGNRDPQRHCTETQSLGWEAVCKCGGEPVPCRVLDPFAGAGTTLMVARRLQRHAYGIELNPKYAEMARKRLLADCPLFNAEVV